MQQLSRIESNTDSLKESPTKAGFEVSVHASVARWHLAMPILACFEALCLVDTCVFTHFSFFKAAFAVNSGTSVTPAWQGVATLVDTGPRDTLGAAVMEASACVEKIFSPLSPLSSTFCTCLKSFVGTMTWTNNVSKAFQPDTLWNNLEVGGTILKFYPASNKISTL